MAVTQKHENLPAQFITDLGKDYATQLKGLTSIPLDTGKFAPQVAPQDPMQAQAYTIRPGKASELTNPILLKQELMLAPQVINSLLLLINKTLSIQRWLTLMFRHKKVSQA